MSHTFFNNLWAEAQQGFRMMIKDEKKGGQMSGDKSQLLLILTELYYKYVAIYKKMDMVYDQIVHPQKTPLIHRLLDLIIARMLEIRDVMVRSELSEYFYQDEYMHWLHWIPDELDIKIPKYYQHNRGPEWLEHQVWLEGESVLKEADERAAALEASVAADEAAVTISLRTDADEELDLTVEQAVTAIQTVERARQGRARYELAKYFLDEEEAQRKKKKQQKAAAEGRGSDPVKAALIIQRLIRRFLAKRRVQKLREEELEFLGLSWGPQRVNSPLKEALDAAKVHERKIELAAERRRRMQRRYHENFLEAQITIEARLRSVEAPEMAERMKWQIRTWALDIKEKQGKIPAIPKAEHGGSKFTFCPEKLPEEVLEKAMAALDGKNKKKGKKDKAKAARDKAKKAREKAKAKKKAKNKKKGPELVELNPPKNFDAMVESNVEYNKTWRRRDETANPEQRHEDQIIIAEKRQLVGNEVRQQVDIAMRAELVLLKKGLEKKKGKKGKKGGKKGKKGKKGGKKGKKGKSKGKKGKKGKKKKGKDLTKDRTLQSLYQELVRKGIIKKYPKIRFSDLQGEISLINGSIRKFHESGTMPPMPGEDLNLRFPGDANPAPTFGDIKRAVKDICVLPVGSPTVHEIAPYTKSVLIAGPEGSGKHSLVHAVCTEMGATLMDLTAKNIAGLYPGKGKNAGTKLMMHMVGKVGRLCQPTVILIDNCEKMYQKKIPKEEKKDEPKRLKKALKKFLKTMDEEDPMIVIGLTKEPWKAKAKPLKKLYQRMIYIPKPEYGSRLNWWRTTLQEYVEFLAPDIHYSLLAKLSESWTLGNIKKAVQRVGKKLGFKSGTEMKEAAAKAKADAATAAAGGGGDATSVKTGGEAAKPDSTPATAVKTPTGTVTGAGTGGRTVSAENAATSESVESKPTAKFIQMDDILKELSLLDPVFIEMDKAWTNWFKKTPLEKQRRASQMNLTGKKKKGDKKGKGKDKGKKGKKR